MDQSIYKTCIKCAESKPLDEYTRRRKGDDTKRGSCKECVRAQQRANPNKRKRGNAWEREQYRLKTDWAKARIQKAAARVRKREVAMRAKGADEFTSEDIFKRDNYVCQICRRQVSLSDGWPSLNGPSVDHIIPISKGGAHVLSNVQTTHLGCNLIKSDHIHPTAREANMSLEKIND